MAKKINGLEVELEDTLFGVEFDDGTVLQLESEEQARFYASFMPETQVVTSLVYSTVWAEVSE